MLPLDLFSESNSSVHSFSVLFMKDLQMIFKNMPRNTIITAKNNCINRDTVITHSNFPQISFQLVASFCAAITCLHISTNHRDYKCYYFYSN